MSILLLVPITSKKYKKRHLYLSQHTYLSWLIQLTIFTITTPKYVDVWRVCSPLIVRRIKQIHNLFMDIYKGLKMKARGDQDTPSFLTDRWVKCWVKVHTSFLVRSIKSSVIITLVQRVFQPLRWLDFSHVVWLDQSNTLHMFRDHLGRSSSVMALCSNFPHDFSRMSCDWSSFGFWSHLA